MYVSCHVNLVCSDSVHVIADGICASCCTIIMTYRFGYVRKRYRRTQHAGVTVHVQEEYYQTAMTHTLMHDKARSIV